MSESRDMFAKGKSIVAPTFSDNVYSLEKGVSLKMEIVRTREISTLTTKNTEYLIPLFQVRELGLDSGTPAEFNVSFSMHRMDAIGADGNSLLYDYKRVDGELESNYHEDECDIVIRLLTAGHGAKCLDGGKSNADVSKMLRNLHGVSFQLEKSNTGSNKDGTTWFDFRISDVKSPTKTK